MKVSSSFAFLLLPVVFVAANAEENSIRKRDVATVGVGSEPRRVLKGGHSSAFGSGKGRALQFYPGYFGSGFPWGYGGSPSFGDGSGACAAACNDGCFGTTPEACVQACSIDFTPGECIKECNDGCFGAGAPEACAFVCNIQECLEECFGTPQQCADECNPTP